MESRAPNVRLSPLDRPTTSLIPFQRIHFCLKLSADCVCISPGSTIETYLKLMKNNQATLLGLALLVTGAVTGRAEQDLITKTFPVKAGGKLILNVDRGSVHISTSDSDKVDIKVTRELKNGSTAEA